MKFLKTLIVSVLAIFVLVPLSANEVLKINTDNTQMALLVEKDAPVYFLYWGEPIADDDFAERYYKGKPDSKEPRVAQAFPAYGGSCYLCPALRVVHPDGSLVTELVYDSHRIEAAGDGVEKTVLVLKEPARNLKVEVIYTAYKHEDVICGSSILYNTGKKALEVKELASSYLPLHSRSYYLSHFDGTWAHEMQMSEERLTQGKGQGAFGRLSDEGRTESLYRRPSGKRGIETY